MVPTSEHYQWSSFHKNGRGEKDVLVISTTCIKNWAKQRKSDEQPIWREGRVDDYAFDPEASAASCECNKQASKVKRATT